MRATLRSVAVAATIAAAGLLNMQTAAATPPVPTPEPGGVIRMDTAPGEWWQCTGWSLQPPFFYQAPGIMQYSLGPEPIYLRFAPGADVWVQCNGTGLPIFHHGPIVKAGW
ncbi:hypothetical protein [Nocardia sp. CC227C]|uniref:hypothetical protein n=1 Tax=Nocardia sp. CC227C TaxID=3044562 RepID=UPI00278C375D|nr:hypothetical protein [Nocardia sp. CC227C]